MHGVGLTEEFSGGAVLFNEAELILVCRKLYTGNIEKENFADSEVVSECYPHADFHSFYTGEIVKVLRKE